MTKIYMQLKNFHQQVGEWVEVYYECLLKLVNCLQVKTSDVSLLLFSKQVYDPTLD
jgi:hypothetical protein